MGRACLSLIFLSLYFPAVAQETLTDRQGTQLRLIPAGRFIQGINGGEDRIERAFPKMAAGQFFGNPEGPAHPTWITKPFYLANREVTVAQFRRFVEDTGYVTTVEKSGAGMAGWAPTDPKLPLYQSYDFKQQPEFNWRNPGFKQEDNHPVTGVSWTDAQAYCAWLGKKENAKYRLPTEAEWEMACRAGTQTYFYWGDEPRGAIHRFANIANVELEKFRTHAAERHWLLDLDKDPEDGNVFTAPVGRYQPNAWGLYDMAGNVWEWCQDYYLDTYYQHWRRDERTAPDKTAANPLNSSEPQTQTNQFRVIRGGGWYNGPLQTRSSMRGFWDEPDAACYIGFRVAREVPDAKPSPDYEAELATWKAIAACGAKVYDRYQRQAYEINFNVNFDPKILPELPKIGPIYHLRFDGDVTLDRSAAELISRIETVERLELFARMNWQPEDFKLISRLKNLKALALPRNFPLNDAHLAALSDLTTLEEFTCYGTNGGLTDEGARHLAKNRSLRILRLYECDVAGGFLKDLRGAPLDSLAIKIGFNAGRESGLTDDNARLLREFPTLTDIDIQTPLAGAGLAESLGSMPRLMRVNLQNCTAFRDEHGVVLGKLKRMVYALLSGTGAGDQTAEALAGLDELGDLGIGSAALTDTGMERISRIMSLESLAINREAAAVTDAGVAELGRLRRLVRCRLLCPKLHGEGLAAFSKMPSLQELTVTSPLLTDVAFGYLASCKSLRKLWLLDRDSQPAAALTNDGLFKLRNLPNLSELWLPRQYTQMTEDKMVELGKLMPKTNVIPYTINWRPAE